jgi:hypothetical protein
MPLQNDEHEGVTGEERSRILTAGAAWRSDPAGREKELWE